MDQSSDLRCILRRAARAVALAACAQLWAVGAFAADGATWTVVGRQGLVRFVIVPVEQAVDQGAYQRQILALCEPVQTCFLNFYTNSSGATPELPLPDAIANEGTATYRRSMKNGVQVFKWSCRMKVAGSECY
jgi:hypothetical protein